MKNIYFVASLLFSIIQLSYSQTLIGTDVKKVSGYVNIPIDTSPPPSNEGKVWLLTVGVSTYNSILTAKKSDSSLVTLPNLNAPAFNASNFKDILTARGLLSSNKKYFKHLFDRTATRQNIEDAFESFTSNDIKPNDLFIFFFSGHGLILGDKDDNPDCYIIPYNFTGNVRNAISEEEIKEFLKRIPAKHKLCFIESCKNTVSGVMGSEEKDIYRQIPKEQIEKINSKRKDMPPGVIYITATTVGKAAYDAAAAEDDSPFSAALFEAYEDSAVQTNNLDGVTVQDFFKYIEKKTNENVKLRYNNRSQIPQIIYSDDKLKDLILIPSHR